MITSALIRGAAEVEVTERGLRPHRLPAWVRHQFPDGQLLPLPDALHPGPAAHQRIGTRFADFAFTGAGPFAA